MRLLVVLALRNLLRHKRRTLLTAAALVFGIAIMILGRAWQRGHREGGGGAGQALDPRPRAGLRRGRGARRRAARSPSSRRRTTIASSRSRRRSSTPSCARSRASRPGSRGSWSGPSSRRATSRWRASSSASTRGARAAVYPALELREGRFFEPGEKGILLNRGRRAQARGGGGRDRGGARHHRGRAPRRREAHRDRHLDGAGSRRLRVGVVLHRPRGGAGAARRGRRGGGRSSSGRETATLPSAPVAAAVTAALQRNGIRARAWTWEEMGGPFIGGMIVTRFVGGILHAVLAIIAAFGVLNTALMSVFERTREIGTIRAVGSRRSRVVALFLLEGALPRGGRRGPVARFLGAALVHYFSHPRHPRLQRGPALLLRRGPPLHDPRLARPRDGARH